MNKPLLRNKEVKRPEFKDLNSMILDLQRCEYFEASKERELSRDIHILEYIEYLEIENNNFKIAQEINNKSYNELLKEYVSLKLMVVKYE